MRKSVQWAVPVAAVSVAAVVAAYGLLRKRAETAGGTYAGSSSCRECHEAFYQKWAPSHHGKAMQPVTQAFVSESLTPMEAALEVGGRRYRADVERREVVEEGADGAVARYALAHALGGKNVFYFLTPLAKGKLQVLPLAYHVDDRRWYDTTGSMLRHFVEAGDQALDWRDPMLTFNTACFGCHVSQLAKNYDFASDSYRTTWREPGISCESCHGPAEEHNRLCRALKPGEAPKTLGLRSWRDFSPDQVNSACAPCHAKMYPLTAEYVPGETYFDHFDLVCLEDRDFSADGRDLGENYTYTLWLMNPCAQKGRLDCVHCHTSSGRYRFSPAVTNDVNAACSGCHEDKARRLTAHSRHPAQGAPGRCISCHMPSTQFAAMRRSDHSHRPPCPEASARFGAASACILCHTDKREEWAASFVRAWHPQSRLRPKMVREGELVEAARKRDWSRLPDIVGYLGQPEAEPVVCASLLRLLRGCPDASAWPAARACLGHASPLVRGAAAGALADDLGTPATAAALFRALADPVRVVRVQAAQALAPYPRRSLDRAALDRLNRAEAELLSMYAARPDDWASFYNLGNYRQARGDAAAALEAYRAAIRLRPDAVMPHVNAAVLASQQGDLPEAVRLLREAWKASPEHGAVNLNLGLALAETGDAGGAARHLRAAMADPACRAQAAYNCAVLVGAGDPAAAAALCGEALAAEPGNVRYAEARAFYLRAAGGRTAEGAAAP